MTAQSMAGSIPNPNPTLVSGLRGTSDNVSGRLIADVADDLAFVDPNAAPLTTLLTAVNKAKKATQRRVDFYELDPMPRSASVTTAALSGDTSITVQSGEGSRFKANDIIINRNTREVFLVTAVSTDTLTVVRDLAGVGGSAISTTDELENLGDVSEEGADIPTAKTVQERNGYNYLQTVRKPVYITRRQATSDLYGGNDPDIQLRAAMIEHKKQLDGFFAFGRRFSRTGSGNKEQTAMGGIESFITTNVWNLNGQTPTENQIVGALEYGMRYGENGNVGGGGNKILFCSRRWVSLFHQLAGDRVRYTDMGTIMGKKAFGWKVGEFQTSHGTIVLSPCHTWAGEHAGYAMLVDPAHVNMRYHQGGAGFPDGRTKLYENRQSNGVDAKEWEYLSDVCIEVKMEMAHSLWKGLPLLNA